MPETAVLERLRCEDGVPIHVEWHAFEPRPDPVPSLDPDDADMGEVTGTHGNLR